jgi:hypothetical protein
MLINTNDFTTIECYKCGILFSVSKEFDDNRRKDKMTFYCPNGHGQSYIKSTEEILREKNNKIEFELIQKNNRISFLERININLEKKIKGRRTGKRTKNKVIAGSKK